MKQVQHAIPTSASRIDQMLLIDLTKSAHWLDRMSLMVNAWHTIEHTIDQSLVELASHSIPSSMPSAVKSSSAFICLA